jgi:hypothetical protein
MTISQEEALATIAFHRAREAGDSKATQAAAVALGKVRGAEALAKATPEQQARIARLHEEFPALLAGTLVGVATKKGRQAFHFTPEAQALRLHV